MARSNTIGVKSTVRCPQCGRVHEIVNKSECKGVRCGDCHEVFKV